MFADANAVDVGRRLMKFPAKLRRRIVEFATVVPGGAFTSGGNFSLNWVAGQSTVGTNQQTVEGYQVVSATGNYSLAYGQFTSQTWGASITTYRMP